MRKLCRFLIAGSFMAWIVAFAVSTATESFAQTNAAAAQNSAVIPAPRTDAYALARTNVVMQRTLDHPGNYDIVFLGDSIMQGWEGPGKNVWDKFYGGYRCLNLGVTGDRTQHVLWRLDHGQLDGIKPRVIVLLIGTNNTRDNSPGQIADGVKLILDDLRQECPETKILLLAVFPRNRHDDTMAQIEAPAKINAIISRFDDGKTVRFLDINGKFLGPDGRVPADIMPDFLHPNARGYQLWADAMAPTLDEMLK